ncbi:hypothetical protein ACSSWA_11045 [Melioribacter sp. Ez-97]|uniref:hypothetical protein n=1 Tax=Melioribacter sp. Ez-97 TaxID=3423434 RepID=UPI003ED903C0
MKYKSLMIALAALITGCNINDPVAPVWDVSVTAPIANKEYLMSDILEDESENLFHYNNGSNKDVLYFTDSYQIDKITFEDKLKIDGFSESITENAGALKIESDTVQGNVGSTELGLNPAVRIAVPPINDKKVASDLSEPGNFLQARFKSGSFDLVIRNNFTSDVSVTVSNISLVNSDDGSVIAMHGGSVTIPPSQSVLVSDLKINTEIYVKNRLKIEAVLSTQGSGGDEVRIPDNFLTLTAITKNLEVSEATAKFPEQDFITINGTVKIGDKNERIARAAIKSGALDLRLTNNTGLDAEIRYSFPQIKTADGNIFEGAAVIAGGESKNLFDNKSLSGYSVEAAGGLLEELNYAIEYRIVSDNQYKTIKSSDNAKADFEFSELTFEEFEGYISPFEFEPEKTSFAFDFEKDKIDFDKLFLSNPVFSIKLKSTADIKFLIGGKLKLFMPDGTVKNFNLNGNTLSAVLITPSTERIYINGDSVSAFIKNLDEIPDSAVVELSGTVNPDFEYVSVKSTDYIEGELEAEIPLDFGIQHAEYTDSIEIELSDDDRDLLRDIKYLEANLDLENGLPVNLSFTGRLYDAAGNFLTYFPPAEFQDTLISVSAAETDLNGYAVAPKESYVKVIADSAVSAKIADAAYMKVRLRFSTAPANKPVKIRSTDTIRIKAFGVSEYKIEPGNN